MKHTQNRLVLPATTIADGVAQEDDYYYVEELLLRLAIRAVSDAEINLHHSAAKAALERLDAIRSLEALQQVLRDAGTELRLRPIGKVTVSMGKLPPLATFLRGLLRPAAVEWARLRPRPATDTDSPRVPWEERNRPAVDDLALDPLPFDPNEVQGGGILEEQLVRLVEEKVEDGRLLTEEEALVSSPSAPIRARTALQSFEGVLQDVDVPRRERTRVQRLISQLHEVLDELVAPTPEATRATRVLVQALDEALQPAGITHESSAKFVYTYAGKLQEMIGLIQTRKSRGGSRDKARERRVRERMKGV